MTPPETLFALFIGHALADYPLQGPFLSAAKRIKGPGGIYALALHGAIHGGFVWVITGNVWLGLAEMVIHAMIDRAKVGRLINFKTDQLLHGACKIAWWAITVTS